MPQPLLGRRGFLSLAALTLHYSCLSVVLHASRTAPGGRYNASTAIFLTELVKIAISLALVLCSGELHKSVVQRRVAREEELAAALVSADRKAQEDRRRKAVEEEKALWAKLQEGGEDPSAFASLEETIVPVKLHRRSSLSSLNAPAAGPKSPKANLSINVALAEGRSKTEVAPSFALIPATPMPIPSPTRTPDATALHPDRPTATLHGRAVSGPNYWQDLFDGDWWRIVGDGLMTRDAWHLAALACLFCFQGNAQFVASGNLSVPVFVIAYQLKIPATALFSILLLDRVLTRQQWTALVALAFGVAGVQLSQTSSAGKSDAAPARLHDGSLPNQALGLVAVIAACASSGFASVYFEKLLKAKSPEAQASVATSTGVRSSFDAASGDGAQQPLLSTYSGPAQPAIGRPQQQQSLWMRNIQLSIFGLLVSLPFMFWEVGGVDLGPLDYDVIDTAADYRVVQYARSAIKTVFEGFDRPLPWIVVILQATGGLLNALVMRHADNLLKCFSISVSIVLSFAISIVLFEYRVTTGVLFGCVTVLASTWYYAKTSR